MALVARGHTIAGRFGRGEILGGEISDFPPCDVAFEFTTPASAPVVVPLLLSQKIPVVSGTTGWDVTSAVHIAREQEIS
ncbi:MAG: hypothetical protein ACXWFS_03680, partial [Thermoanaerobaculia bacterium]